LLKDYSNWCPEVYQSLFVDRINDDKIRIAPCCQASSSVVNLDQFNFNTDLYLNTIREQFDNNLQAAECNRCWNDEKLGKKSRRQSAIEFYSAGYPDKTVTLESLDHSATWACNLSCIMCGPDNSSTWAKELNLTADQLQMIGRKFQKKNNFLSNLDLTTIKKIHFNGGEPLINNDQLSLLQKLDDLDVLKDVFISYNTNGTVDPSDLIKQYWGKARLVKLFFSIDAVGSAFEYIRWPASWHQTENNILNLKKTLPSNIMFGINATVGAYNVFELCDVDNWFEEHLLTNREGDPSDFNVQFASNYDLRFLPTEIKKTAIEKLSKKQRLLGITNYLKSTMNVETKQSWIDKLTAIDQRRNSNWVDSLEIGKYYKDSKC
jgi:hypothetical protein